MVPETCLVGDGMNEPDRTGPVVLRLRIGHCHSPREIVVLGSQSVQLVGVEKIGPATRSVPEADLALGTSNFELLEDHRP